MKYIGTMQHTETAAAHKMLPSRLPGSRGGKNVPLALRLKVVKCVGLFAE
jgi:hypothetical protein